MSFPTSQSIEAVDAARIAHHYRVERELADRLRQSTRDDRLRLYREVYDLLFERVPDHPQLRIDERLRHQVVATQARFLRQFIGTEGVFLEIGAGDCRLTAAMAPFVRRAVAVDVSAEITRRTTLPANCQLVLSDGCNVPVEAGTVTLAFSDQLMEHLHPADAVEQLRAIHAALAPGGVYICFTPSRLSGPHDVSKHFDACATGFHLREYTLSELSATLRAVGFKEVRLPLQAGGRARLVPSFPVRGLERALDVVPRGLQRAIASRNPVKKVLGRVAAIK
jgi:SAM-dependent methyltransferase